MANWWKSRRALVGGALTLVVLSGACVQLAPIARTRFAGQSDIADADSTARAAAAIVSGPASTNVSRTPPSILRRGTAFVTRGPISESLTIGGRVAGTD